LWLKVQIKFLEESITKLSKSWYREDNGLYVGLCPWGCCFMQLQFSLFFFFCVLGNQPENGLQMEELLAIFPKWDCPSKEQWASI
jgi:hypothetical protein